ncbi:MAG: hypothetical protein JXB32_18620 [Deltaproteobacteria bacterium]|nr:hypothetical protein [Deltaproteobacteria bacterium]
MDAVTRRLAPLAALVALGLAAACGHDWSPGGDGSDAPADVVDSVEDDAPVAEDGLGDEATDVPRDEYVSEDAPVDSVEPEDAPSDVVEPDDAADDASDADVTDVPPVCTTPTGHDEDGDGIDDGCDNCPTYVNAGQDDEDGDTLGDACEAPGGSSMLSGLARFEAFWTDASPGDDWFSSSGTWSRVEDGMSGYSTPSGGNLLFGVPAETPYSVEAQFRFRPLASTTQSWSCVLLGAQVDTAHAMSSFWSCCFERQDRTLSIWRLREGSTSLDSMLVSTPLEDAAYPAEAWRRLRAYWDGMQLRCTLDTGSALEEFSAIELVPPGASRTNLDRGLTGLRVYNGELEFRSFVLYR